MYNYELCSGNRLKNAIEICSLPANKLEIRTRFMPFPSQTGKYDYPNLSIRSLNIPRFSVYSLESVVTTGFRLHESINGIFTDASLNMDIAAENADFNAKLNSGQDEDLGISRLSAIEEIDKSGPLLLLCSDEPSNFGSWIYRMLAKMLAIDSAIPYSRVFCYVPNYAMQMLRVAGFQGEIVPQNPRKKYLIKDALVPSLPAPHVLIRDEIMVKFWEMADRIRSDATLGDCIYISRRGQSIRNPGFRVLLNETAIFEGLRQKGFKEFIPESYSFSDQVSIIRSAKIIINCGGSGLFNCVFARNAELIVDLESSTTWLFAHTNLMESVGCAYTVVMGEDHKDRTGAHANWHVSQQELFDGLSQLGL